MFFTLRNDNAEPTDKAGNPCGWGHIKQAFEAEWPGYVYVSTVQDTDAATTVCMRHRTNYGDRREFTMVWE